jgi:hypothetical protein
MKDTEIKALDPQEAASKLDACQWRAIWYGQIKHAFLAPGPGGEASETLCGKHLWPHAADAPQQVLRQSHCVFCERKLELLRERAAQAEGVLDIG